LVRIARLDEPAGSTFGFGSQARQGWVTAGALGLELATLADVVDRLGDIGDRMAGTPSDRDDSAALAAPVGRPGKVMAVGLNYLKHIEEVGKPPPSEPMIFAKYPSAVTGPVGDIELCPDVTAEVDYECELAVVIGQRTRRVEPESALDSVLGYCVANDVSARDVQRREPQISRSKSLDTFCPIGPWITTSDDVADPHDLRVRTLVNGVTRQDSTTADLLFGIPFLISYLSRTMTLEPGDVILTGTPSGVGSGMRPPVYLNEGDVVRCEISSLGHLENRVVTPKES
jgi:2-keto-4-pentenoate hydratase/2-oxohepta-3-ene-1,7-dioic acid hydratase in catechol pathway